MNGTQHQAQPEIATSYETSELFVDALDLTAALGNHELKALTLVVLGSQVGYLNRYGLGTLLRSTLKTAGAEWQPNLVGAFKYCQDCFEPIGQVVKGSIEGLRGPSEAFSISDKGYDLGIPFAGLIMDWSLRYPDISVQDIFGPSHSKGEARSPQHRAEVLIQPLTHPRAEYGVSISDMAELDPTEHLTTKYHTRLSALDEATRGLERTGLVRTERVAENNDRIFEIIDPIPTSTTQRSTLTTSTEKLYEYIQELYGVGETEFSFSQALKAVTQKVLAEQPSTDPADIRTKLKTALTGGSSDSDADKADNLPGIVRRNRFNEGAHTRVFLNEDSLEAISDLVSILVAVDSSDKPILEYGRQRAQEILASPADVKMIGDKAYRFSSAAKKLPREITEGQFMTIFNQSGSEFDTRGLAHEYEKRFGRLLTVVSVRSVMKSLIDGGAAEQTMARSQGSIRTQRAFYRAASTPES